MFIVHLYITITSSVAERDGACICASPRSKNIWDFVVRTRRDRQTHRQTNQQFHQRQVHKVYEAIS
ncbi:MAG: hypothetical protein V7K25_27090 [Nostoc sp.]